MEMEETETQMSQPETMSQFLEREGPAMFQWASRFQDPPQFSHTEQSSRCAHVAQEAFHLAQVALRVAWGLGKHNHYHDDETTDFLMIRHELVTAFRAVDEVIPKDAQPFRSTPAAALCLAAQSGALPAYLLPLSVNPAPPVHPTPSSPSSSPAIFPGSRSISASPPPPLAHKSSSPVLEEPRGSNWISPAQILPSNPSSPVHIVSSPLPPPTAQTPVSRSGSPAPSADEMRMAGLITRSILDPLCDKLLSNEFVAALAGRVADFLDSRVDAKVAEAVEKHGIGGVPGERPPCYTAAASPDTKKRKLAHGDIE